MAKTTAKKRARLAPKKKDFKWEDVLAELRSKPTVSVPKAGFAIAGLSPSASYDNANTDGSIGGVPVIETGKKKRCPSIAVLRKLGLADEPPAAA